MCVRGHPIVSTVLRYFLLIVFLVSICGVIFTLQVWMSYRATIRRAASYQFERTSSSTTPQGNSILGMSESSISSRKASSGSANSGTASTMRRCPCFRRDSTTNRLSTSTAASTFNRNDLYLKDATTQAILYIAIFTNQVLWYIIAVVWNQVPVDEDNDDNNTVTAKYIVEVLGKFFSYATGSYNAIVYLLPSYKALRRRYGKLGVLRTMLVLIMDNKTDEQLAAMTPVTEVEEKGKVEGNENDGKYDNDDAADKDSGNGGKFENNGVGDGYNANDNIEAGDCTDG